MKRNTEENALTQKRKSKSKEYREEQAMLQSGKFNNRDVVKFCFWLTGMFALTIIDLTVIRDLLHQSNFGPEAALALTFLLSIGLQLLPACISIFCEFLEKLNNLDLKRSKSTVAIIIGCVVGTIALLVGISVTRINLHQYGAAFYGEQVEILPIVSPLVTTFLALALSFMLFPSEWLIDSLMEKLKSKELKQQEKRESDLKEEAHLLTEANIPHFQLEEREIASIIFDKKVEHSILSRAALAAAGVSINANKVYTAAQLNNICNDAVLKQQLRNSESEAYLKTLTFLTESLEVLAAHFRQIGYPPYFQNDILAIDPALIIKEYIKNAKVKGGDNHEK